MPKLIITETNCSYCGRVFLPSRDQWYRLQSGRRVYHSRKCQDSGKKKTIDELFLSHVQRLPNGCLEWTGYVNGGGYSVMGVDGGTKPAHHVAWFRHYGYWPPPEMEIDHTCHKPEECKLGDLCRHRRCVEWSHLDLVTPKQHSRPGRSNAAEAVIALKRAITHCPQGHEYTPENTRISTDKNGRMHRNCRMCAQIWSRQEGCPQGHDYTPDNTYIDKRGHRRCRECIAVRRAARKAASA